MKITLPSKDLIQNWWRNQKLYREAKIKRIQFYQISFTTSIKGAYIVRISLFTFTHWRRKWQLTPVFLPGESQGWGSLLGCRLWGRTESDTTEVTSLI